MSYYQSDRATLLQRLMDVQRMLDDTSMQLHNLPDETDVEMYNKARLVAWTHLDRAWADVYQAWSVLMEEEQALKYL